jgi:hypothetical protein
MNADWLDAPYGAKPDGITTPFPTTILNCLVIKK